MSPRVTKGKSNCASGQKIDPTQVYVVYESFASGVLPGQQVFPQGTRLRGEHAAVVTHPERFVLDGTPDNELPHRHHLGPERPIPAEYTRRPKRIGIPEGLLDTHTGERVRKDSPEVKGNKNKKRFVPILLAPDVALETALVARQTMTHSSLDGEKRVIHAGQIVPRKDRAVKMHPHNWTLPDHEDLP